MSERPAERARDAQSQTASPTSPSLDGLGDATLTRRRTGPKVPVDSGQGREDGLGVCTEARTRTDISDTRHVEGSRKSNEGTFDRWLVTGGSKGKASQPNCARKTRRTSAACASCPSLFFPPAATQPLLSLPTARNESLLQPYHPGSSILTRPARLCGVVCQLVP